MTKHAKQLTKKSKTTPIYNNLVVISDLHCGCQTGICSPEIRLDSNGTYQINKIQQAIWEIWLEFWQWVPRITNNEPFVLVVNGDAQEGRHHNSISQITQNKAIQEDIAFNVLQPHVKQAAAYYHIRGTSVHAGESGEDEERLARRLGANPDQFGNYARNDLWIRIGQQNRALGHILHHVGTTGSQAYESTAVMRELAEAYIEAGRWRKEPPDFIIRSHRHRCIVVTVPTANHRGICATTPAWQGKTPFAYRIPGARQAEPQWGGLIVREAPDGVWYLTEFVRSPERGPVE